MTDRAEISGSIRFAPFELVLEPEELRRNGIRVKVSGQALQVLIVLASEPGQLVTREHLRKTLWPTTSFGDFEHGLNAAVNRLREILGDSAVNPKYIETIPRRGYRFIAPMKVEDEQVASSPHIASTEPPRRPAKPFLKWWITLAVAAAILIGLVYLRLKTRLEEASRLSGIQRLTVVPLTSLPGNVTSPAFSPDGSEVAFGWDGETNGAGYDVYVKVIGSENPLRITRHPSVKLSIAWSPDGRVIAISRVSKAVASGIFLVPPTGGPERKIYSRSSTYWYGNELSWSSDGKYLAFTDHPENSYQSIMLYLLSMGPIRGDVKKKFSPFLSERRRMVA
jgi:DNA-binding winged helix-turn-helix (wHTH) protein